MKAGKPFLSLISSVRLRFASVVHLQTVLLTLLLCGMLCACVEEQPYSLSPEDNFEALWTLMDTRYCFLEYKEQELGISWDEIHTRYRQRIHPNMSQAQLFEVLAAMLSELQDGHVNLHSSLDMGRNWSWYEDHPKNLDQELRETYLGTDYRISSGLKYRILEDNIAYVVCESFATPLGEGNITQMMHTLRASSGMILDMRGNSGGSLEMAQKLASHFTNERVLVGYIAHKTGKAHDAFSTPQAEYVEPSNGLRWQKRVVVLTNRQCYSATNTFIRDMKAFPRVTVLGDQTGGGSGMPLSSELPNGWGVRFSACPMYDAEMQQIEFGIEPDIPCALRPDDVLRGEDTLIEQARQMLAE